MTFDALYCSINDSTKADSENTNSLSILSQLSHFSWAKSPTDVGKAQSALPIKIQKLPTNLSPELIHNL